MNPLDGNHDWPQGEPVDDGFALRQLRLIQARAAADLAGSAEGSRLEGMAGPRGEPWLGTPDRIPRPVEILGQDPDRPGFYYFREVSWFGAEDPSDGSWQEREGGLATVLDGDGLPAAYNAREANGNASVPAGEVVLLYHDLPHVEGEGNDCWRFWYCCTGGGPPATASPGGDQDDYDLGNNLNVEINTSTNITITGLVALDPGTTYRIVNVGTGVITWPHESSASLEANRIVTHTGTTVYQQTGAAVTLTYSGTLTRWVLTGGSATVTGAGPSTATDLSAGSNDNVDLGRATTASLTATGGAATLTGLRARHPGARAELVHTGASGDITAAHLSGSSSAGNQIQSPTGADITLSPGESLRLEQVGEGSSAVWLAVGGSALSAAQAEAAGGGGVSTVKYTRTFADFATASPTNTLTLASPSGKANVLHWFMKNTTAFDLTQYNLTLQYGASAFTDSSGGPNVMDGTLGGVLMGNPPSVNAGESEYSPGLLGGSAWDLKLSADALADDLDTATAGAVDVYVTYLTYP